jgi:hypothetical protein
LSSGFLTGSEISFLPVWSGGGNRLKIAQALRNVRQNARADGAIRITRALTRLSALRVLNNFYPEE